MARVEYIPDNAATGRYMRSDPALAAVLRAYAQRGAVYARSIAPRDTGAYAASISVQDGPVVGGGARFGARQSVNVVAGVPHAAAVEWGRGGRARSSGGYRVLARVVDVIENS